MDRRTTPRWGTGGRQGVITVGLGLAFRSGCNLSLAHFRLAAYDSCSPLGIWQEAFLCPLLQPRMPLTVIREGKANQVHPWA